MYRLPVVQRRVAHHNLVLSGGPTLPIKLEAASRRNWPPR